MEEPLLHNPYRTLSVPKDATLATIRSAHRKLVLACHPDKVQEESAKKIKAEQFHQVQQAYEVLSDETRRQRYDDKVKLAELRAEMNSDRGPPRRAESYQSPRYAGNSPIFEVRNGRVYEERVPGRSHAYEEDIFSSKFADARPSARRFDEMFPDPPPSHQRRTSARQGDDRRRMYEVEEERQRRERDVKKAREAAAREEKERKRTKDRRRDMEAKSSRKFSTHMDTDGSDSDMDDRRYSGKREATPPKRRYEEVRRKSEWDEPRRSSKREDIRRDRNKDADDDSIEANVAAAQAYMSKSRETFREGESESRSRPSRKRADSNLERGTPIPPPPMPSRPVDNQRRSSERERSDKERSGRSGGESDRRDDRRRAGRGSRQPSPVRRDSGKKDKKYREPELVEPVTSGRKASLPIFGSDGKGFKEKMFGSAGRKEPHRSATNHQAPPEFKHPGMRRAETMPINNMRRNEPVAPKSSHLKNTKAPSDDDTSSSDDSDSSDATNDTPEIKPRNTTHKYKVNNDPEAQSPRTVYMEPEDMHDLPKARHSGERPRPAARGSSNRPPPPPSRSATFTAEDRSTTRPSGLSRGESARSSSGATPLLSKLHTTGGRGGKKSLFGAVDNDEDDEVARFMQSSSSPKISSPKISAADIRYSNRPRRASEDVDRDAYPGSLHKSHRRPSYQRGETAF